MPDTTNTGGDAPQARASSWLSQGFESFAAELPPAPGRHHVDVDVLIVGSGYGGAVAAATLAGSSDGAGNRLRVAVLERGKEYLPGAFPARMASLAGHVRFAGARGGPPRGNREGLFDVRMGPDVNALVANGLGGGSLINAGVMATPTRDVFDGMPGLQAELAPFYERARTLLGAGTSAQPNTIALRAGPLPDKYLALRRLGEGSDPVRPVRPAPITVAMTRKHTSAGIELDPCKMCGDCATGCNHNAKESLDTNLLVKARRQNARLYTGATVLRVQHEPAAGDYPERWCVHVVFTDGALRAKHEHPFRIYCRQLILAAGTFGSTEILLRSRSATLAFSEQLGRRFSSNGDMITVAYGHPAVANAVANEDDHPERGIGPTITGMLEAEGMLVEELAVPGPLRRLFEEIVTTANTLHVMGATDQTEHKDDGLGPDPCAVDARAIRHSSVLALMGDDGAAGSLELTGENDDENDGDGTIRVRWPDLRQHRIFRQQLELLKAIVRDRPAALLPNPMWKLLPDALESLLSQQYGPPLTVHPLGGCPMGANVATGAVNDRGQVYQGAPGPGDERRVFGTLSVLDGSIVPNALGVNPALTIAALALRAAERLRDDLRQLDPQPAVAPPPVQRRPVFRLMQEPPVRSAPTQVEVVERMAGRMIVVTADRSQRHCMVELTMRYLPAELDALLLPTAAGPVTLGRTLKLRPDGALRLYDAQQWDDWKLNHDAAVDQRPKALLHATLTGTLRFFDREASGRWQRTLRAIFPWLLNRGARDTVQWVAQRYHEGNLFTRNRAGLTMGPDFLGRLKSALRLASRAGEVRLFDYDLAIGDIVEHSPGFALADLGNRKIHGRKRFTYSRASNPWHQLTRLDIDNFPSLAPGSARRVELDTGFLVDEDIPLLRILQQQDQPSALGDMVALGGFVLRLLLGIHMWSFRKPDTPRPRSAQRLPGSLPHLPEPHIHELEVGVLPDGTPVFARLTRYHRADMANDQAAVLMIHGYSASGTSFAHPAVEHDLARHMYALRRDVWILDLRTSSGMPTARHPWSFEDAALADIPAAIDFIGRKVRAMERDGMERETRVDVVAHCMGAAMLSMAVLSPPKAGERFFAERTDLPKRIRRVVLSQVGPLVVFSQANVFRAYLMGYLNKILPLAGYTFRVEGEPTLGDELLDRLLATLPYPDDEFRIENPLAPWRRTPFTGTRHRMDALYGRDFSLANIGPRVLDNIDDFFGPLSIDTVGQAIQLARHKTICNRDGRNVYVSRAALKQRWMFDTLCVHGVDNGLADIATLGRMRRAFDDAGIGARLTLHPVHGSGHQDWLIGTDTRRTQDVVGRFLAGEHVAVAPHLGTPAAPGTGTSPTLGPGTAPAAAEPEPPGRFMARVPYAGPVRSGFARIGADGIARGTVGCLSSPVLHGAVLVAFVPVVLRDGRYAIVSADPPRPDNPRLDSNIALYAGPSSDDGWMTFQHPCAPPGADGMLMLVVYDASTAMSDRTRSEIRLLGDSRLRDVELIAMTEKVRAAAVPAAADQGPGAADMVPLPPQSLLLPLEQLLKQVANLIRAIFADVRGAIEGAVGDPDVDGLRNALLTAGVHDVDPAGHRPAAAAGALRFALASCQYPSGILDKQPAYASYRHLAALLDDATATARPEFLVLMGDQIYSDATAGLLDPTVSSERYVRPYEKWLSNEDVQAVLHRLPTFMMLDDHEIADNWERDSDALAPDKRLTDGVRSYVKYQRNGDVPAGGELWWSKDINGFQFFMADTRTGREARTVASTATASIMTEAQWQALEAWLRQEHDTNADARPRFIATSSLLLPRRLRPHLAAGVVGAMRHDAWEGYPASLQRLLGTIATLKLRNLVFLSGDEHVSIDARITLRTPDGSDLSIRSIHSSALYAPYPFANASADDFEEDGASFAFDQAGVPGGACTCTVQSAFRPGDGFAVVAAVQGPLGSWQVDCDFHRAITCADRTQAVVA